MGFTHEDLKELMGDRDTIAGLDSEAIMQLLVLVQPGNEALFLAMLSSGAVQTDIRAMKKNQMIGVKDLAKRLGIIVK